MAPVVPSIDDELAARFPLRILVAEDDPITARLVAKLLARFGYQPDVVDSGEAAVEAVEQGTYDLVLMDLQMPNTDGTEATRRIRASARVGRQPRIVALTATLSAEDAGCCAAVGMDGVLRKPVQIAALMDEIVRTTD